MGEGRYSKFEDVKISVEGIKGLWRELSMRRKVEYFEAVLWGEHQTASENKIWLSL